MGDGGFPLVLALLIFAKILKKTTCDWRLKFNFSNLRHAFNSKNLEFN